MEIKPNQAYSFHQVGHRDYQEDSRFPATDMPKPDQRFFVVCDGVGGCEKGEVASQTVCEAFAKAMKRYDLNDDFSNDDFQKVLGFAYNALDREVNDENKDMATTLTFLCFHGGGCTMAHIGDSRIYHIRPTEGILYRTDDHSMVNSLVHIGMLTPEEAINHPQSNVISRYMESVGSDEQRCMATVMRTVNVEAGDYFFLCTDGVLHQVTDDQLLDIICSDGTDEAKMQKIAELSKDSEDNNTAYLVPVKEVLTDAVTAESTEMRDEDTHATLKIKVASQQLEEIESVKEPTMWQRIKQMFN